MSLAVPSSLAITSAALKRRVSFISFSAQETATPGTCGVAMLVPLREVRGLPRPAADEISTPGGRSSGAVVEKGAIA